MSTNKLKLANGKEKKEKTMRWIGIDLHQNAFNICIIDEDGNVIHRHYRISEEGLDEFKSLLNEYDEIAVEATGNTSWFCNQLKGCYRRLVVVNTRKFKEICKSVKKTDKHDAFKLAFYLKKDLLPECRLRTMEQEELTSLLKTRDMFAKQGTDWKNKIHSLYVANGQKLPNGSLDSIVKLKSLDMRKLPVSAQFQVRKLRDHLIGNIKDLYQFKKAIANLAKKFKGYASIISIKGIGIISAAVLLAYIGNIKDFSSAKKLAAYAGLVPWLSQSNGRLHLGKITKRGDKLVRKTLVLCGLVAKRYCPVLKGFHDDVKRRRGGGKANVALARKLLDLIYHTLKNKWVFTDFDNGVKA